MESFKGRICAKGIWDESIPGIRFNKDGISSYYELQKNLISAYPKGETGKQEWLKIVKRIKESGKRKKYDCLVGISGGTDSSYLLHLCKEYNLRVLAVNLDNGWNSDIAVKNIKKITSALNYDLFTFVIDYEEVKRVLRAYLKASLPWVDSPTDLAIKASLYKTACNENVNYILNGSDFRTEGKQPLQWTYSDYTQFKYLLRKFEPGPLKSFPVLSYRNLFWLGVVRGIKVIRPYYFLEYSKDNAQKELKRLYDWQYYGGHHHENLFTRFIISYWMYEKFGIDKRKITLSAQILNGDISRDQAIKYVLTKPYDPEEINLFISYICKKLDLKVEEFSQYMVQSNKYFSDYPNSYKVIYGNLKFISWLTSFAMSYKPLSIFQSEFNSRNSEDYLE